MKTAHAICLKSVLNKKQFTQIKTSFARQFGLPLETCDGFGRPVRSLSSSECLPEFCRRLRFSKVGYQRCKQQRLRCMKTAARTALPAITVCHAGIVLACVPAMDGPVLLGGIFFGRCLDEPYDDYLLDDVLSRLRSLQIYPFELDLMLAELPVVTFRWMQTAAEFLYVLLYQTTNLNPPVPNQVGRPYTQPCQLTQTQYTVSDRLPVRLIAAIKTDDCSAVKEMRDHLLKSGLSKNCILRKSGFIKQLSSLIHTAAKTGTPLEPLTHQNIDCLHKALYIRTPEDIKEWIRRALDNFIATVRRFQDIEKMTKLAPAIEVMHVCYDQQLTLEQIAGVTGLSISRLGHLFVEQLGITPIDYLNSIRIVRVKHLLRITNATVTRIAYDTGFMNPGYLTHVFKKITGQTPTQY